jgi:hypothetical protein
MPLSYVIDVCLTCHRRAVYPFCEHRSDTQRWTFPLQVHAQPASERALLKQSPNQRTSNMPLQLDYRNIANWEDVCLVDDPERPGKRLEHPWNFTMGVFLMHTGIQSITRDNAAEFYMRAKLIEVCFGSLFTNGDGTPRYLTTEDVVNYIGLSSNVSKYTTAQFFSHLRQDVIRNLTQTMEYALRDQDKAAGATTTG